MWHIETKDDTFNRLYILWGTLKPKMTQIKQTVYMMWHIKTKDDIDKMDCTYYVAPEWFVG